MTAAILILSDKGAQGLRQDTSGPQLQAWLEKQGVTVSQRLLLADDPEAISRQLHIWAKNSIADLLLTCGGTGLSPRDCTPEATRAILDKEVPGLAEAMRAASAQQTPHAWLSRAVAGMCHQSLILNLPGSPRAAISNLQAVWPCLEHAIAKLQGDSADCGPAQDKA